MLSLSSFSPCVKRRLFAVVALLSGPIVKADSGAFHGTHGPH